jgi:putative BNR repeat neuraminidase
MFEPAFFRSIFIISLLLSAVNVAAAQQAPPPGPWRVTATVDVHPAVWPWNWASWDQDKIITVGDFQYTLFWDAEGELVLARRNLRNNDLQTLGLPEFKLSKDDAHRNTCLGVSPGDGRLHLSWDHHNNPLRYTRSRKGFLTNPPPRIEASDIEPQQAIAQPQAPTTRVTYPRFFSDANGRLFLFYRQGGSGNGENYLYCYDSQSESWQALGKVFSSNGTWEPWEQSKSRNAYLHDLLFDANNRLHATWVYRENSATWASNHDLHYATSDDGGLTWCNNAGQTIADLSKGDPIALDDPGIVVREIPVFSWIMNAGCMALDSNNRPHVVTYKLQAPEKPEKLRHSPPAEITRKLRFVHYWRTDDGRWLGGDPIEAGIDSGSPRRGDIVFAGNDTLLFFYQPRNADGGFVCLQSAAADQWTQWRSYRLTNPDIRGLDASKHDRQRWARDRVLSLTVQKGTRGFAIVDLHCPDEF